MNEELSSSPFIKKTGQELPFQDSGSTLIAARQLPLLSARAA
jgi:hypothetical protein